MNRREVLKSIGIFGAAGLGSMALLSSCEPQTKATEEQNTKSTESKDKTVEEKPKTEREKKIINREEMSFADPENPTKHELKHTPEISILEQDPNGFSKIKITIGQQDIIHPTTPDHWIDYLELKLDGKKIAYVEFEAGMIRGFSEYFVDLSNVKEITAEAGCNLHGIWTAKKTV